MNDEQHSIVGTIPGVSVPASWADDDRTARIDICKEIHEGKRLTYLAAYEDDISVRVDLDKEGWERLSRLAIDMFIQTPDSVTESDGE